MTKASNQTAPTARTNNGFLLALGLNAVWINISEVWRYFVVVKPMLNDSFPGDVNIAAVTPMIFVSWMLWDTVLLFAATGLYWLYLAYHGQSMRNAIIAATALTVTVFGLFWLGVANIGFAPIKFLWVAVPLAWIEQVVAAIIVLQVMKRA